MGEPNTFFFKQIYKSELSTTKIPYYTGIFRPKDRFNARKNTEAKNNYFPRRQGGGSGFLGRFLTPFLRKLEYPGSHRSHETHARERY